MSFVLACAPAGKRSRARIPLGLLITLCAACSTAGTEDRKAEPGGVAADPPEAAAEPAPWQAPALAPDQVPSIYVEEWRRAENRDSCAPLAPVALGDGEGATPRAATFSGGWAVAYDQPGLRSAFGVAGAGVSASEPSYAEWPFTRQWADGSTVGYGPEGGTGPNELAYLRVEGQGCLYNVWSRIGREHLEFLLAQLRFVAVG